MLMNFMCSTADGMLGSYSYVSWDTFTPSSLELNILSKLTDAPPRSPHMTLCLCTGGETAHSSLPLIHLHTDLPGKGPTLITYLTWTNPLKALSPTSATRRAMASLVSVTRYKQDSWRPTGLVLYVTGLLFPCSPSLYLTLITKGLLLPYMSLAFSLRIDY